MSPREVTALATKEEAPRTSDSRGLVIRRVTGSNVSMTEKTATYVTTPKVGTSHTIQLDPRQEKEVQDHGKRAPREVEVRGTGKRIVFFEGQFATDDESLMEELETDERWGFGLDFDIDPLDPTGYWRNCEDKNWRPNGRYNLEVETKTVVKRKTIDDQLGVGPRPLNTFK